MKFQKRKTRNFVITILAILFITVAAVVYFFYVTKAPIVYGEVIRHIKYKEGLELDLYLPTKEKYSMLPVVVFFHGGAWIGGSKSVINANRFNDAVNKLREDGYAIVTPNYSLARQSKSPFPRCIEDGFDALQWIYNHRSRYNLDINNVGLFGESAGAHIAMMVAYSNLDSSAITTKYVIDVYGPSDLYHLSRTSTVDSINAVLERMPVMIKNKFDIIKHLYGFDPKSDTVRARLFADDNSPLKYIDQHTIQPIVIIHGYDDRIVPVHQSSLLIERLKSSNVSYEEHFLEGVDHAFMGATASQKDSVQHWIYEFIVKNYTE